VVGVQIKKINIMAITFKRLGRQFVLVSNICLGTMNFFWQASEEESF
jgi:hypothetical protein